jgi:coenzyme F420-reducing hydrogenase alpha subunit
MNTKTITIDPITRLEGHGKITIFLNEAGNVKNSYFQVPELRGFEKFCEVEDDTEQTIHSKIYQPNFPVSSYHSLRR